MSRYFTSKEVLALTAKGTLMSREEAFAEIDAFYGDPNALGRSAGGDSAEGGMDIDNGSYSQQLSMDGMKVGGIAASGEVTCGDVSKKVTASQLHFKPLPSTTALTKAPKPTEAEYSRHVNTDGALIGSNSLDAITADIAHHPSIERCDSVLSLPPVHARSKINNTLISISPLPLDSATAGSTNPLSTTLREATRGAHYQTPPPFDTNAVTDEIYHSARSQVAVHSPLPHPHQPTKDNSVTLPQPRIIQSDLAATPEMKSPTMTDPPSSDKESLYDEMQSEDNLRRQQGLSREEILTPTLFSDPSDARRDSRRTSKADITGFEDIPAEARGTPPFNHVHAAREKADAMTKRDGSEAPQKGKEEKKGTGKQIKSPSNTKKKVEDGPSKAMPRRSARQLNIEPSTDDLAVKPVKTSATMTKKRKDTPVDEEDIQQPKKKKVQSKAKQDPEEKKIAVKDDVAHDDHEMSGDPLDKSRATSARPAGSHPLGKRELILLGVPHDTGEGGRKTRAQAEKEVEEAPKRGKPRKTQLAGKCA